MSSFATEVRAIVNAPPTETFERIVPIDLPSVFPGFGPLPAVSGTRDQTGGWDAAGQTRTILLADGSSAHETLTEYRYPGHFAYDVRGFTGILGRLAKEAHGEWWFDQGSSGASTAVRWRYAFTSRSAPVSPIVWFITKVLWRGYMRRSLTLAKVQVEQRTA